MVQFERAAAVVARPKFVKRLLPGFAYAAVLAGFALPVGRNLDRWEFWTDEAETAILAKGVLERGVPSLPTDGSIHYPFQLGWADGSGVWRVTPWLDEYVAAASFAVFGVHAWSARLPFLLLTLGAAGCVMRAAYRLDARHRTSLFCGAAFLLSHGVASLSWQSRYYAVSLFAQGLWLLGVYWGAAGRRARGAFLLAAGMAMQFHSNYLPLAVNVACLLAVASLLWRRNRDMAAAALTSLVALACVAAPWMLYAGSAMRASVSDASLLFAGAAGDAPATAVDRLRTIAFYAGVYADWFPVWLILAVAAAAFVVRGRGLFSAVHANSGSSALLWTLWLLPPLSLVLMALMPLAMPRYVLPFAPALCVLLGWVVFQAVRTASIQVPLAALVLLTGADLRPFQPAEWFQRSPVFLLLASFSPRAPQRATRLADFVRDRSPGGERVLTLVDDLPLHFYLDGRVQPAQLWIPSSDPPPDWIAPQRFGQTVDEAFGPPPASMSERYERRFLEVELEDPEVRPDGLWRRRTCVYRLRDDRADPAVEAEANGPSGYPVYLLKPGDPSVVARLSPVDDDAQACRATVHRGGADDAGALRLRRSAVSREILLGGGWRIEEGREYEIRFRGRSDPPRRIGVAVVGQEPPAREFAVAGDVQLGLQWSWHRVGFIAEAGSERTAIDFLIGGAKGFVDVAEAEIAWVAH